MESQPTKTCKMCRQQIDSLARKCHFCHHWQNKFLMAMYHPVGVAIPLILVFLFVPYMLNDMFDPGEDFSLHKDQVLLSHTKLDFGENDCGKTIVIIGKIKNDSGFSWEKPRFEVKFFDETQTLFDTEQDEKYDFLIPAQSEIPFKVTFSKQFPEERYANFEIHVIDAKEKSKIF